MTPVDEFRSLHGSGCFLLPNPWDIGSARFLHGMGFEALATTSAGFAFSRGLPDSVTALGLEEVMAHVRAIVTATPLPVNADFQSGYAESSEGLAENVARCVKTGAAGLSIEDATGRKSEPLYSFTQAVERIRASRRAVDRSGGAVLTARCEAALVGDPDPLRTALQRLPAYAEAGADCLFAPGVRDAAAIRRLVREVAPKPLNVLVSAPGPGLTVTELADLGVRRISVGSALARVAWGAFMRAARSIASTGRFDALSDAAPIVELNSLFAGRESSVQ